MDLLDDAQRQLLIEALTRMDRVRQVLLRTGYIQDDATAALIAMLSGADTKVWVEKP